MRRNNTLSLLLVGLVYLMSCQKYEFVAQIKEESDPSIYQGYLDQRKCELVNTIEIKLFNAGSFPANGQLSTALGYEVITLTLDATRRMEISCRSEKGFQSLMNRIVSITNQNSDAVGFKYFEGSTVFDGKNATLYLLPDADGKLKLTWCNMYFDGPGNQARQSTGSYTMP